MKKQVFMTLIILSVLAFMPITTKADYPTGTLGYSDEIAVDSEFGWTVSKLTFAGDFTTFSSEIYINTTTLEQGDEIKIVVTDDPDNGGDWYDLYLNDVEIATPTLSDLIYSEMDYFTGISKFINPVTYTNTTGTYNIYEQLLEEVESQNDEYTLETSGVGTDSTYDFNYQMKVEYKITGDVYSVCFFYDIQRTGVNGGNDYSYGEGMRIESTLNIRTGLLGKMEMYFRSDSFGIESELHMLIDSGYAETPYSWAYSFLGLTVIAAVVGLVKRKR